MVEKVLNVNKEEKSRICTALSKTSSKKKNQTTWILTHQAPGSFFVVCGIRNFKTL